MSELPLPILERLKKIQALAESGIEGERANANKLLNELLLKHGITLQDLAHGEAQWCRFVCAGRLEIELLTHVVLKVCQTRDVVNAKDKKSSRVRWFKLTAAQCADVTDAFEHYKREFKTCVDDTLVALIHRHNLFAQDKSDEKATPTAEAMERAKRIWSLMAGMTSRDWKKPAAQITGGAA